MRAFIATTVWTNEVEIKLTWLHKFHVTLSWHRIFEDGASFLVTIWHRAHHLVIGGAKWVRKWVRGFDTPRIYLFMDLREEPNCFCGS